MFEEFLWFRSIFSPSASLNKIFAYLTRREYVSRAVRRVQKFQKPSDHMSLCCARWALQTEMTPCIAMCKYLISTTSLLIRGLRADIISRYGICTYSHILTPLFDAVPLTTLSRALPLHHSDAVQKHISNGVAALWTVILCWCVRALVWVTAYLCLTFAWEFASLCRSSCG